MLHPSRILAFCALPHFWRMPSLSIYDIRRRTFVLDFRVCADAFVAYVWLFAGDLRCRFRICGWWLRFGFLLFCFAEFQFFCWWPSLCMSAFWLLGFAEGFLTICGWLHCRCRTSCCWPSLGISHFLLMPSQRMSDFLLMAFVVDFWLFAHGFVVDVGLFALGFVLDFWFWDHGLRCASRIFCRCLRCVCLIYYSWPSLRISDYLLMASLWMSGPVAESFVLDLWLLTDGFVVDVWLFLADGLCCGILITSWWPSLCISDLLPMACCGTLMLCWRLRYALLFFCWRPSSWISDFWLMAFVVDFCCSADGFVVNLWLFAVGLR